MTRGMGIGYLRYHRGASARLQLRHSASSRWSQRSIEASQCRPQQYATLLVLRSPLSFRCRASIHLPRPLHNLLVGTTFDLRHLCFLHLPQWTGPVSSRRTSPPIDHLVNSLRGFLAFRLPCAASVTPCPLSRTPVRASLGYLRDTPCGGGLFYLPEVQREYRQSHGTPGRAILGCGAGSGIMGNREQTDSDGGIFGGERCVYALPQTSRVMLPDGSLDGDGDGDGEAQGGVSTENETLSKWPSLA
ncbi:hypothetical protein FA13DRAFT_756542 [Coprinellus micaceus]|uniref:Uncharacterized protein n=1 Tax=Coprinellus micaceus TaxID=71717 RepID=A0A4Y7T3K2_COPMI|nr:hypothetical protein FA13DRAFT_756542 [Coprinellus micaceus]